METGEFQAPTPEELDASFPSYSIDAFIAQGGMGAVYLGTQVALDRMVAIKVLPRELGEDENFRAAFQAEARAMAKLNHPNLIGVYDFGEADGMPYIVMEYVNGKALYYSSHGKMIDPTEAARIVAATCRGLQHAHEHDVLHRDVKPANILLDQDANPRLGDFGLAMQMSAAHSTEEVFGTPGYAAPEVYHNQADHRSDLYAAAVLLYELITGQLPGEDYLHPSQFAKCDRRYDTLLSKALQPDPDHRHQSAGEFADDLAAIGKKPAVPVAVPVVSPVSPPVALASAKKSGLPAVLVSALALLALGAGAFVLLRGGNADDEQAGVSPGGSSNTVAPEPAPAVDLPPEENIEAPPVESPPEPREPAVAVVPPEEEMTAEEGPAPVKQAVPEEKPVVKPEPVSTFDHMAFLKRGRNNIRKAASGDLSTYESTLGETIKTLERTGERILRGEDDISRATRNFKKKNFIAVLDEFRAQGRLPSGLASDLPYAFRELTVRRDEVLKAVLEAQEGQEEADRALKKSVAKIIKQYSGGLQKKADQLRAKGNEFDATILEGEAESARSDFPRFVAILRGEDLPPPALVAEKDNPVDPFIGSWTNGNQTDPVIFTFTAEGGAGNGRWIKDAKWVSTESGYEMRLRNGNVLRLAFEKKDVLQVTRSDETIFRLWRVVDHDNSLSDGEAKAIATIVGHWTCERPEEEGIVFLFLDSGRFKIPATEAEGKVRVEEDFFVLVWGNGMVTRLIPQDDGEMVGVDTSGEGDIGVFTRAN